MTSPYCADICGVVGGYTPAVPVLSGERIIELRKRKGWSQAKLAEEAKVSPSKLSRIEKNKPENPRLDTLERLAVALNVSVGELFPPRPEESGHAKRAEPDTQGAEILKRRLEALDGEMPADDSWRGDVLKAISVLNRALRRADTTITDRTATKAGH